MSLPGLACHWGWQGPLCARQSGGYPTDSVSCCFVCSQLGCHGQQKEMAGKSPKEGCPEENHLQPILSLSSCSQGKQPHPLHWLPQHTKMNISICL